MPNKMLEFETVQSLFEGPTSKEEMEADPQFFSTEERAKAIFKRISGQTYEEHENAPNGLPFGPLALNQATLDFMFIMENICDPKKSGAVNISFENDCYRVAVGDKKFDLSFILNNMDARFVTMSEGSKINCVDLFKTIKPPHHDDTKSTAEHQSEDLHESEKKAIYLYTTQLYSIINGILRGSSPERINKSSEEIYLDPTAENFSSTMQFYFKLIAMILSGLNRLPDTHIKFAFRGGEHSTSERTVEKENSITNPDTTTKERAFISTSIDALRWKSTDEVILFHDVFGKDISGLTDFDFEHEFLIPPTQVKYEYKIIEDGKIYYIAKPVFATSGLTQDQTTLGVTEEAKILQTNEKIIGSLKRSVEELQKRPDAKTWNVLYAPFRKKRAKDLDPIKLKVFEELLALSESKQEKSSPICVEDLLQDTRSSLVAKNSLTESAFERATNSDLAKNTKRKLDKLKTLDKEESSTQVSKRKLIPA